MTGLYSIIIEKVIFIKITKDLLFPKGVFWSFDHQMIFLDIYQIVDFSQPFCLLNLDLHM